LHELVEAGANLFRINTAHGDWDTRRQWIGWIGANDSRFAGQPDG
jgi:pyruvate kinase